MKNPIKTTGIIMPWIIFLILIILLFFISCLFLTLLNPFGVLDLWWIMSSTSFACGYSLHELRPRLFTPRASLTVIHIQPLQGCRCKMPHSIPESRKISGSGFLHPNGIPHVWDFALLNIHSFYHLSILSFIPQPCPFQLFSCKGYNTLTG